MEILHVIDDYVILIGFGCLLIIYFSTKFFRKNDTSKVIKIISGKWKSLIYDDEDGDYEIYITKTNTETFAIVELVYSEKSSFKKNEYHKFNCDYVYVEKEEIHRFRQKEFNTNQYFCISIDEDPKSSSHLISMNPHDVCILDIERMYFK
tara:strand:+ start:436 stop:885 length:450 start_codon:yes stop_codon:yes gene_type:complete